MRHAHTGAGKSERHPLVAAEAKSQLFEHVILRKLSV